MDLIECARYGVNCGGRAFTEGPWYPLVMTVLVALFGWFVADWLSQWLPEAES